MIFFACRNGFSASEISLYSQIFLLSAGFCESGVRRAAASAAAQDMRGGFAAARRTAPNPTNCILRLLHGLRIDCFDKLKRPGRTYFGFSSFPFQANYLAVRKMSLNVLLDKWYYNNANKNHYKEEII